MILVVDKETGAKLPFSRGILTRSITLSGVDVGVAYAIASAVQKELIKRGKRFVTTDEIRELTYSTLIERGLREEAERYLFWRTLRRRKVRLTVLLGGATGVGKSTIATELAFRLGILSIIGTDTIREVLRKVIARELLPDIHVSSFLASNVVNAPRGIDPLIYGFETQVKHVSVGIKAVLERSRREGLNAIIEGIHVVPGFIELDENEFMYVITVPGRESLLAHFYERARYSPRGAERYVKNVEKIMRIQDYIVDRAKELGIPVIENVELEKAVTAIMEDLMKRLKKEVD
ncbi:2-phosphoglycerate kinase [Thermococcus gammatolerans]|uniref:2-phosphoglycerate kinase n=1 Tax=Thermococcus gammatolerans (strain DSM 15229 / JCM 11827 / EJ3) TaxID=593117 RepID=C5A4R4_THEGJ|nr:2-phosphoglycerate kinase [Thermococcus gammatolerans]ACS33226.1 2-phosphoglycerate kinase, containing ATP cone domain [Thermococcus gammatolerans EJ3]